jgi:hypothetical protein
VASVPGGAFFPDGTGQNALRLSFSVAPDEQFDAGTDGTPIEIRP